MHIFRILSILVVVFLANLATAFAAPTVTVMPPEGARFLVEQRFDLRVEAKPESGDITKAVLTVDGQAIPFTSQDSNNGITGYNRRGFSFARPGVHTVTATVTDSTGTTTTSAKVEVLSVRGKKPGAKNIIILLGDGMGTAHRTAARIVRYGVVAGRPQGFLAMERFPVSGLLTTSSFNSLVTDSAPGMACYATGNHARNGQEGVYPATLPDVFAYPRVEYMSEYLHRTQGKSLGIVTTADVEDATPAANAVHSGNRGAGQGICDQFFDERDKSGLTVLLGGGRRWFLPQKDASGQAIFGSARSEKNDYGPLPADLVSAWLIPPGKIDPDRNLLKDFTGAGFAYAETASDLKRLALSGNAPDKLLGLFAYGNMNVALDKIAKRRNPSPPGVVDDFRAPDQPMLDEMAAAALNVLSKNRNGFVLMVEGASIDKQSHAMDGDRAICDTIEFDRAVQVCREFAERDGNTIVIVTADHECAGFSVVGVLDAPIDKAKSLPSDHDATRPEDKPARQTLVNQDAFPAYRILTDGYPETFDVPYKLLIGFGSDGDRFENWLTKSRPLADGANPADLRKELLAKGYPPTPADREEKADGFFIRGQVARTQADHTAGDVPINAFAKNRDIANLFLGVQENTNVFFHLMRAVFGGY